MYEILRGHCYEFQCRGKIKVKGKGEMTTYLLVGRRAPTTIRMDDLIPVSGGVPGPPGGAHGANGALTNNVFPRELQVQQGWGRVEPEVRIIRCAG